MEPKTIEVETPKVLVSDEEENEDSVTETAQNPRVREMIWKGKVPVKFVLNEDDCASIEKPIPFYVSMAAHFSR